MRADGGFAQNGEYVLMLQNASDLKMRKEVTFQYVADHIWEAWDMDHIISKARANFAFGTLGSQDFVEVSEKDSTLFEIFTFNGLHFKKYAMAATSYFYSLLILLGVAVAATVYRMKKGNVFNPLHVVTIFTLFGIMVYVMIFEANNRQLYNHVSWFVIGGTLGIESVLLAGKNVVTKIRSRRQDRTKL